MHRLYENDEITIFWDSDKCRHAKVCVHQSPTVFNKDNRPWVNISGAPTAQIWKTVSQCLSGSASDPPAAAWTIVHTGVAPEYEGKGIAKRLVFKVAEEAEKRKTKVIPVCSYAAKVLEV